MRKIVVAVASIRQNSSILLYSSDDLEDMIYSSCAESWSMDTVEKHLDAAIADADRATSRLNEVIMQRDEGRLAALGLIIAAIGGVSALQSLLQLVGMNIRDGWDLFYVRVGALVFYVFHFLHFGVDGFWSAEKIASQPTLPVSNLENHLLGKGSVLKEFVSINHSS